MKLWKYEVDLDPAPITIGLFGGIALFFLDEFEKSLSPLLAESLFFFVWLAAVSGGLVIRHTSLVKDSLFTLGLAVALAGFYALVRSYITVPTTTDPYIGWQVINCLFGVALVAVCFYQAQRDESPRKFPYPKLFQAAWATLLLVLLTTIFVGLVFLVLYLWGELFELIGIKFFSDLFSSSVFRWSTGGFTAGIGIALMRELDAPILAVRRLILETFRVLAVIVAIAGLAFLLALPFTGITPLWNTRAATPILLSMVFLFILFLNGAIQDGQTKRTFWRPVSFVIMAFIVVLPIYGLLGLYSTWLRVAQYGLMPDRVYALVLGGLALGYGIAYALSVILKRMDWPFTITNLNPRLALATAAVAIVMHIPMLDPVSLSAKSQQARLQSGAVAASDFDFGTLKFSLGKPGQRALDAIRNDSTLAAREDIKIALADLAEMKDIGDWWMAQSKKELALPTLERDKLIAKLKSLPVFPSSVLMPDGFIDGLNDDHLRQFQVCENIELKRCALIALDFNRDRYDDIALWNGTSVLMFPFDPDEKVYKEPVWMNSNGRLTLTDLEAADKAGTIKLVPPVTDSLMIGDKRFD